MNSTTSVTETLLETMDVQNFLKNIQEFDAVTQKQCLLKARRELLKPGRLKLHSAQSTRKALITIRVALENGKKAKLN